MHIKKCAVIKKKKESKQQIGTKYQIAIDY